MKAIDFSDLLDPLRIVTMVSKRVVRIRNVDLRIDPQTPLPADHQGRHPRQVRPECHHEEVAHQRSIIGEGDGDPRGLLDRRRYLTVVLLCLLDALLDLPDSREVLLNLAAVRRSESSNELPRVLAHQVKDALAVARAPGAGFRIQAEVGRAEQTLEGHPWVDLRRHGRRGRAPGDAVGVGAAVARIAVAHRARVFTAQLNRWEAGLDSHLLRGDLVRRDARVDVGAGCLLAVNAGQE